MKTYQIMEHGRIKEIDALDDETFAEANARYEQNTKFNRLFDLAEFRRDPEVFVSPRLQVMDDYYYSIEKEVRGEKLDKIRQVRLEKEAKIEAKRQEKIFQLKFALTLFVISFSWKMFNYYYPGPVIHDWIVWFNHEYTWVSICILLFIAMSWFNLFSSTVQNVILGGGFLFNLFK